MSKVALLALVTALAASPLALGGAKSLPDGGEFGLPEARAFSDFPLYYLGDSYRGLALKAVYRTDDEPQAAEDVRRDDVTFVYGTCVPTADAGCLPPLQVQNWSACERHAGVYRFRPDQELELRGARAAFYEGHRRLELYAGPTTVVVYAAEPRLLREVALDLRGANVSTRRTEPLTPARRRPC